MTMWIMGKFIRSRLFSVLFVCLSIVLTGYVSVRLSRVIEAVFSIKVYAVLFMLLCIYLEYMLFYEVSSKLRKAAYKIYIARSVLLFLFINMILSFLVVDGIGIVYTNHICFYEVAMLASFFITIFAMLYAKRIKVKEEVLSIDN